MRKNDQYFQPGDKVMRVNPNASHGGYEEPDKPSSFPVMGQVYCVEGFYEGPLWNTVMLVGFGGWRYHPINGTPVGWRAAWFRKVEEIKLCVEAVKSHPVQVPISVPRETHPTQISSSPFTL